MGVDLAELLELAVQLRPPQQLVLQLLALRVQVADLLFSGFSDLLGFEQLLAQSGDLVIDVALKDVLRDAQVCSVVLDCAAFVFLPESLVGDGAAVVAESWCCRRACSRRLWR